MKQKDRLLIAFALIMAFFIFLPSTFVQPILSTVVETAVDFSQDNNQKSFLSEDGISFMWIEPGIVRLRARGGLDFDTIQVKKGFWITATEITQKQYENITGKNPSRFRGKNNPVDSISWHNAVDFCAGYGTSPYGLRKKDYTYRLPTRKEWEYAARGGVKSKYASGNRLTSDHANFNDSPGEFRKETVPVASYNENSFGLFDFHGNVREWCNDKSPNGITAYLKGGSWESRAKECAYTFCAESALGRRSNQNGFRMVLAKKPGFVRKQEVRLKSLAFSITPVFFAAMLVYLYATFARRKKSINSLFSVFAHMYKGKFTPADLTGYPRVTFEYSGMTVVLKFFSSGEPHNEIFTCLTFRLLGALRNQKLRMEVAPASLEDFKKARYQGMARVERKPFGTPLGSVDIDTNDVELFEKLVVAGLDRVIQEIDIVGGKAPTYISLNAQRLVVKKMKLVYSLKELQLYVARVFKFIDMIIEECELALDPGEFVVVEESAPLEQPVCEICGTDINGPAAVCTKCDTPHHVDCWKYNGVCCTFACGSDSFIEKKV